MKKKTKVANEKLDPLCPRCWGNPLTGDKPTVIDGIGNYHIIGLLKWDKNNNPILPVFRDVIDTSMMKRQIVA